MISTAATPRWSRAQRSPPPIWPLPRRHDQGGDLHSLSGTMAISETTLKGRHAYAIEKQNEAAASWPAVGAGGGRPRLRLAALCEKCARALEVHEVAAVFRQLDLGQPEIGPAGLAELELAAAV
jgi:hypothetical protein